MAAKNIYIDPKQMDKIMNIPLDAAKKAMFYLVTEVWAGFREEPPIDHGKLRGEWHMERMGDFNYKIASATEYATQVAYGTGVYGPSGMPYTIKPKVKQCLYFMWQGMEIFAKSVTVQGQKPNPFHERAIKRGENRVDEFIRRALREMGE